MKNTIAALLLSTALIAPAHAAEPPPYGLELSSRERLDVIILKQGVPKPDIYPTIDALSGILHTGDDKAFEIVGGILRMSLAGPYNPKTKCKNVIIGFKADPTTAKGGFDAQLSAIACLREDNAWIVTGDVQTQGRFPKLTEAQAAARVNLPEQSAPPAPKAVVSTPAPAPVPMQNLPPRPTAEVRPHVEPVQPTQPVQAVQAVQAPVQAAAPLTTPEPAPASPVQPVPVPQQVQTVTPAAPQPAPVIAPPPRARAKVDLD